MNWKIAVRAMVVHQGKLLCVRLKAYEGVAAGGYWCLPGGRLDHHEGLVEGLRREMIEETGVKPEIGELLYVQQFVHDDTDALEFFFHVTNGKDYLNVDLLQTTHGALEIEQIAFVDPAKIRILPLFLSQEPLPTASSKPGPKIYSYTG